MEKIRHIHVLFLGLIAICLCLSQPVHAEMEWTLQKQMNLEAAPIDISTSIDGQWIFVLTPGEVFVYSVSEDKITDRIPVDKTFDRISHSFQNNNLILSSSSEKTLKIIQLEVIQKIDISGLPFKGPQNAPIVIAVFSDYQCPYCGRLETLFQQVLEKYPKEVKLVFKNFPIDSHRFARKAATAALAANKQGKFWEFHHKLFENSAALSDEKIQAIAKELKLNLERFNKDINDPAIQTLINRDFQNGIQAGIRGTPSIFINGKLLQARSLQDFQQKIEAELKKNKEKK